MTAEKRAALDVAGDVPSVLVTGLVPRVVDAKEEVSMDVRRSDEVEGMETGD